MLYIIAGLVFIVLIAVLVMRKNKAQKPTEQPSFKADKAATLPKHTAVKGTNTQANVNSDKRFDHIEIAQRFMEQQRYDKAIDTLEIYMCKLGLKESFKKIQDTYKAEMEHKA